MGKKWFPTQQLRIWAEEGLSVSEIAKKADRDKSNISRRLAGLNIEASKKAMTGRQANLLLDGKLNTLEQMRQINSDAHEILSLVMAWNRGDDQALQVLESQVRKVRVGRHEHEVTEYKFKDPRDIALRAMAEIRGQLELQAEIIKSISDQKNVMRWQEIVLGVIGEIDPIVRDKIYFKLKEADAIFSLIDLSKEG